MKASQTLLSGKMLGGGASECSQTGWAGEVGTNQGAQTVKEGPFNQGPNQNSKGWARPPARALDAAPKKREVTLLGPCY